MLKLLVPSLKPTSWSRAHSGNVSLQPQKITVADVDDVMTSLAEVVSDQAEISGVFSWPHPSLPLLMICLMKDLETELAAIATEQIRVTELTAITAEQIQEISLLPSFSPFSAT